MRFSGCEVDLVASRKCVLILAVLQARDRAGVAAQETFTHGRILYTLFDPFVNQILKGPVDRASSAIFGIPECAIKAGVRRKSFSHCEPGFCLGKQPGQSWMLPRLVELLYST